MPTTGPAHHRSARQRPLIVGHSLRGLPDEDWLRQALLAAEARP